MCLDPESEEKVTASETSSRCQNMESTGFDNENKVKDVLEMSGEDQDGAGMLPTEVHTESAASICTETSLNSEMEDEMEVIAASSSMCLDKESVRPVDPATLEENTKSYVSGKDEQHKV